MAKIGDFGLAHHCSPFLGQLLKCWQWLAPEVIDPNCKKYNETSDVYSLGIIIWESLTRKYPFEECSDYIERRDLPEAAQNLPSETLRKNGWRKEGNKWMYEEFEELKIKKAIIENDLRPSIPHCLGPRLINIMKKCWMKNPKERPSTKIIAETLHEELNEKKH
eukprot:TRINITY_DN7864_c0_g3_i4.p1 TRINITY_DN7864_c0_g3~~TRINITY_DN7864_c0_g3_i4.p1  ORF type:complete len:187 (-),score=31.34 TRINITY_DN7864_c0_g3_i4:99-590(-)